MENLDSGLLVCGLIRRQAPQPIALLHWRIPSTNVISSKPPPQVAPDGADAERQVPPWLRGAGRPLHYKRGLYAQLGGAIGLQIEGVLFSKDFVSVTKTEDERWGALNAAIITDTTILPEDAEVVAMTKEPLEQRIRLSVQDGGGNIFHQGVDEKTGIITV
ncbi:NifU-like protein 5, mitochondrial [Phytophthora ramorum]|uniref:NifU-like protein 5, mitochondrial n=1 Tax=Phytophthora ramorum TaxID=164328 RepID=UPI0030AD6AA4|nr:NifU-like protein 5, mitochondrial [Phytophthora ramorum]